MNNKGKIAISEIVLLVVAVFAFAWMIGLGFGEVSAKDPNVDEVCYKECEPLGSTKCSSIEEDYEEAFGDSIDVGAEKTIYKCTEMTSTTGTCTGKKVWVWFDTGKSCDIVNPDDVPDTGGDGSLPQDSSSPSGRSDVLAKVSTANDAIDMGKKGKNAIKKYIGKTPETQAPLDKPKETPKWWAIGGGAIAEKGISATGVIGSIVWAAVAFAIGRYVLGPVFGLSIQNSQALGYALGAGTAAGIIALDIIGASSSGGPIGIAIGVAVAATIFLAMARKYSMDVIKINCFQWDSQPGGKYCELCNKNSELPCTEYQCASLGQGCELINDESSGRQLCIWANPNDINPPIIKPWEDNLLDDFRYSPNNAVSPPDRGVYLIYEGAQQTSSGQGGNRCVPAFAPVRIGVELNEPAKCKISPIRLPSYDEMPDFYMGTGIRDYNHSFSLSLPSLAALEAENITLDPGQNYELYVRCRDSNGNANAANFVFEFCIDDSPDITAPEIVTTSIMDGFPIGYGQKEVDLDLYLRDSSFTTTASGCKWSHLNKAYADMENQMECSHSFIEINGQLLYVCSTTLNGLKDMQNNKFYFRCTDDKGNSNDQSYLLNLIGTQPLVISSSGPTGIIEDSTSPIKVTLEVETALGYSEGLATCSFSLTGNEEDYIMFANTNSFEHTQELWLEQGDYKIPIRCHDLGGNMDNATIEFSVDIDLEAPIIIRVFKEDNNLKIITDEESECVYSTFDCTYEFDDGNSMLALNPISHTTEWNIDSDFYIKCKDKYGNQPLPNQCSIIARPFEIFELQEA